MGTRAQAFDESKIQQIAQSRYWQLLMHYHPTFLGGVRGESNDPEFYLSPIGRTNPQAELKADIAAFMSDVRLGPRKQPAACAFPERYRYLKAELGIVAKDESCPDFQKWKAGLDARSVTLVFASAFLNNPASMFGHTFLRIDSQRSSQIGEGHDLLGYGVSYGAGTGDDPTIGVVVLGLLGGYNGYYSLTPYFEKINEYNDGENRDLWEYRINLKPDQVDRLVNHLWEMASSFQPYYFFDKNCSSQMLSLLEVANPDWHLSDRFFYWVIPVDTLRVVAGTPGAVSEVKFRPSLYRRLRQDIRDHSDPESTSYQRALRHNLELSGDESPRVLRSLIEFQDYQTTRAKKPLNDAQKATRRKILIARARAGAPGDQAPTPIVAPAQPESGSPTTKLSSYGGSYNSHGYLGLRLRLAFHDLLDWDEGYSEFSEVVLGQFDLRYHRDPRVLRLESLTAAKVTSLNPISQLNQGMSWSIGLGAQAPRDLGCERCTAGVASLGAGLSGYLSPSTQNFLLYSLIRGNLQYGGVFEHALRVGPSAEAGLLAVLPARIKLGPHLEYSFYPGQPDATRSFLRVGVAAAWSLGFLSKKLELRAESEAFIHGGAKDLWDHRGELGWYF